MKLIPREALVKTSDVDYAVWNYDGPVSFITRARYRMVLSLLPMEPVDALLEVGYGSGVFMPELAHHTRRLAGADVHAYRADVERVLDSIGISAELVDAPAEDLPWPNESFDVVVVVSAFEFVRDPILAADEISRVLKPDGRAIVVTPAATPILDAGLRLLTGADARKDFGRRREAVIPALRSRMHLEKLIEFPSLVRPKVYRALRLAKRERWPQPGR
jgi:ubiquinone/menaquinone biosynthesis C-methylase UbiE